VTAGCALPNVSIGTGARTTGEALLGGGYSTSGSIEIRDSFPSTAAGEPVADGSLATAWTVVFAGGDGGGSGVVWVNCSTESGVGTRVFSHALGGQTSTKAVCPAGRSVTGGGYRSGWDAATYFLPRVVASYPDPDQRNAWTVWETITNYNADTHPSPQGTAYIVCASAGLSTTVVSGHALTMPPDPALSNPLQDPNCSKPGGPLLPTCSAVRHGDATATCSSGVLVGASAITLRDTTPANSGVGTRPAQSYAMDGGMYLTATVPATGDGPAGPIWNLQVRYNQLGSPTDPHLAASLSLRTLTICAA
jgi:hypothetical protein